jgi:hypothetical protein
MLTVLWFPFGEALFGLWLFGCLPLKPPTWLTEGPAVDPIVAEPALARVLFLTLLITISVGPWIWIDTSRLRRRFPLSDVGTMLSILIASRSGAKSFAVLTGFLGIVLWFVWHPIPLDSYFVRINATVACGFLMIFLLPPTAIVLGSTSDSGELLAITAQQFFPFRVVSLLDGKRLGSAIFLHKIDNLRTMRDSSWRNAVHRLAQISPIVIVDARMKTPAVIEEIEHMLHEDKVPKAAFVVNDDGSAPGLEELAANRQRDKLICCTAGELPRLIASFKRTGTVARPIKQSQFTWRPTKCAECGSKMRLLMHLEYGVMVPISPQLMMMMDRGDVKGSFCCKACGRT